MMVQADAYVPFIAQCSATSPTYIKLRLHEQHVAGVHTERPQVEGDRADKIYHHSRCGIAPLHILQKQDDKGRQPLPHGSYAANSIVWL